MIIYFKFLLQHALAQPTQILTNYMHLQTLHFNRTSKRVSLTVELQCDTSLTIPLLYLSGRLLPIAEKLPTGSEMPCARTENHNICCITESADIVEFSPLVAAKLVNHTGVCECPPPPVVWDNCAATLSHSKNVSFENQVFDSLRSPHTLSLFLSDHGDAARTHVLERSDTLFTVISEMDISFLRARARNTVNPSNETLLAELEFYVGVIFLSLSKLTAKVSLSTLHIPVTLSLLPYNILSTASFQDTPMACEIGSVWNSTWRKCTPCSAGEKSTSSLYCEVCHVGTYSTIPPSDVCPQCGPHHFNPRQGQTECIACGSNLVGNSSRTGCECSYHDPPLIFLDGACWCSAGYGGSVFRHSVECTACPTGFYSTLSDTPGVSTCEMCDSGFIVSTEKNSCVACPEHHVAIPGATSCTRCGSPDLERPNAERSKCICIGDKIRKGPGEICFCANGSAPGSLDPADSTCFPCGVASVSVDGPAEGVSQCTYCNKTQYANTTSNTCYLCPNNSSGVPGVSSAPELCKCAAGEQLTTPFDKNESSLLFCEQCPKGYISQTGTLDSCTPCDVGFTTDDCVNHTRCCTAIDLREIPCQFGWVPHADGLCRRSGLHSDAMVFDDEYGRVFPVGNDMHDALWEPSGRYLEKISLGDSLICATERGNAHTLWVARRTDGQVTRLRKRLSIPVVDFDCRYSANSPCVLKQSTEDQDELDCPGQNLHGKWVEKGATRLVAGERDFVCLLYPQPVAEVRCYGGANWILPHDAWIYKLNAIGSSPQIAGGRWGACVWGLDNDAATPPQCWGNSIPSTYTDPPFGLALPVQHTSLLDAFWQGHVKNIVFIDNLHRNLTALCVLFGEDFTRCLSEHGDAMVAPAFRTDPPAFFYWSPVTAWVGHVQGDELCMQFSDSTILCSHVFSETNAQMPLFSARSSFTAKTML